MWCFFLLNEQQSWIQITGRYYNYPNLECPDPILTGLAMIYIRTGSFLGGCNLPKEVQLEYLCYYLSQTVQRNAKTIKDIAKQEKL